jgi:pimeloyl-ACP methyl ester carboxylesterase
MPTVRCGEAVLHYETRGDGPAVVFVHGSGGNTLSWWQQVPHFARHHLVLTLDLRGFGRSSAGGDASPLRYADDVAAVLDDAGVARAALVCQSLGGMAGLPFAVAHPDRVTALVLCGTPGGVVTAGVADDFKRARERVSTRTVVEMTLAAGFVRRHPAHAFLYEQVQRLNPRDALERAAPQIASVRVRESDLAAYRTPTLLIAGAEDAFFSPETLAGVAEQIPGAAFALLPEVGHSPYFEVPDEFNSIVEEFLRRYEGGC